MGHDHGGHEASSRSRLRAALAITATIFILELVGGVITGSIALLADAGHMLTDVGALTVALFAAYLASRPRDAQMSFGYGRVEILAALGNGVLLGGVSVAILFESLERLWEPRSIDPLPMITIAVIGLAANLVSAKILQPAAHRNLNTKAALFHVIGDALGSVAAIVAGLSIWLWNWTPADALAGLVIALLVVGSAVHLVRESIGILLDGVPRHLNLQEIAKEVVDIAGIKAVHDLHIWTVSSGFFSMSAHVDLVSGADAEAARRQVHQLLHQKYGIVHTTIQTEAAPALLSIEGERTL